MDINGLNHIIRKVENENRIFSDKSQLDSLTVPDEIIGKEKTFNKWKPSKMNYKFLSLMTMALLVTLSTVPVFAADNPYLSCPDCNSTINTPQTQPTIPSKIPSWVRHIFIYYGQGDVSEDELLGAIKFLINQGIMKLN